MLLYINDNTQRTGTFNIKDPEDRLIRQLTFHKFHDKVKQKHEIYSALADFKDMRREAEVTIRFKVQKIKGLYRVIDVEFVGSEEKGSSKGSSKEDLKGSSKTNLLKDIKGIQTQAPKGSQKGS